MTDFGEILISDSVLNYLRTLNPYSSDEDILNLFIEGCINFKNDPQDFADLLETFL